MGRGKDIFILPASADDTSDYFGPQWTSFTGLPGSRLLGNGWQSCVHPDDLPSVQEAWHAAMEKGEPFKAEFRLRDRTGAYHPFSSHATALRDASGRIVRWFGMNIEAMGETK
jgi:PAS domain S-box-containing protein